MKAKTQKKTKTNKNKKPAESTASAGSRDTAVGGKASAQKVSKTPGKKTADKKGGSDGAGGSLFSKSIQFLREAKTELKKVKWPTKKEYLASTAVVIVLSLLVAFYLGLIDFGLIKIIKFVLG